MPSVPPKGRIAVVTSAGRDAVDAEASGAVVSQGGFHRERFEVRNRRVGTVQRLLKDARTQASDINTIFLTGGSSIVPALRDGILSQFPGATIAKSDLLGSVGMGLSLDARSRFGLGGVLADLGVTRHGPGCGPPSPQGGGIDSRRPFVDFARTDPPDESIPAFPGVGG